MVAKAIGMSRTTTHAGLSELKMPSPAAGNTSDGRARVHALGLHLAEVLYLVGHHSS